MANNVFNSKTLLFGLSVITAVAGIQRSYASSYPHNLNSVLDYYGFKEPKQKQALRFLMQKAGIKDVDMLLSRRAASQAALSSAILELVEKTQNKFMRRNGKEERWEVHTLNWMEDAAEQENIISALIILNMIDAVPPVFKHPDAICVLGATKPTMDARLEYAAELFMEGKLPANWLIMLAGERYVAQDKNGVSIDGSEDELNKLAMQLGKRVLELTETDLMKAAYEKTKLYGKFVNRTVLIDTPRKDLPRPTTETTVNELCVWLKQHPEVQKITFVSNQPHVYYQEAIIEQVFKKQGMKIKFEVIGPKYRIKLGDNTANKINQAVQGLGSRIWAATPGVMDAIGLELSDSELRAKFKKLYEKQPLIYNNYANFEPKPPKPKM